MFDRSSFFFKFHDIFEVFVVCLWIFFFCSHKQVGIANRNCTNLLFSSDIHSLFCLTVSMVAATISLFFFFYQSRNPDSFAFVCCIFRLQFPNSFSCLVLFLVSFLPVFERDVPWKRLFIYSINF